MGSLPCPDGITRLTRWDRRGGEAWIGISDGAARKKDGAACRRDVSRYLGARKDVLEMDVLRYSGIDSTIGSKWMGLGH